jgi:hypothetical protein
MAQKSSDTPATRARVAVPVTAIVLSAVTYATIRSKDCPCSRQPRKSYRGTISSWKTGSVVATQTKRSGCG